MNKTEQTQATGIVVKAFGNLLHVRFEGAIRQGEVAMVDVDSTQLKAEVIEIVGDQAKLQVFEDIRGVEVGTRVFFTSFLLEAELGPGLLSSIFDGLQNPLEGVAETSGLFLNRGVYLPPLNHQKRWDYTAIVKVGDVVSKADILGQTQEGRFTHKIMVPFSLERECTITWAIGSGSYTIDTVIAKGTDSAGIEHHFTMKQKWPVKIPLLVGEKIKGSDMLQTGLRVIDTQFPLIKGGTFCSPGPFGAGKTVMQHHLSKYSSVDIVVIVACGERAGEVVEVLRTFPHLTDPHTNDPLMNRTVMICNTSSMPVSAREASIYMGATIAEYYRQMGLDVLLLADSTSRWAQAIREISGRLEEIPGEEAFPAYLSSRIAAFYERSGVVKLSQGGQGSVTIGGTVSPAGGNFEEPVTQATLSVVGAFHGLSRQRSDARRYPAVDPLISWTKYLTEVGHSLEEKHRAWSQTILFTSKLLQQGDEIGKRMEVVGEEGTSLADMILYLKAELYDVAYLQQNAFDKEDAFCPLERQLSLFALIELILKGKFHFSSHDSARDYFVKLQNEIKHLNTLHFSSEKYSITYEKIKNSVKKEIEKG